MIWKAITIATWIILAGVIAAWCWMWATGII